MMGRSVRDWLIAVAVFLGGCVASHVYYESTHLYAKTEFGGELLYWGWLLIPAIGMALLISVTLSWTREFMLVHLLYCVILGFASAAIGYLAPFIICVSVTHGACV